MKERILEIAKTLNTSIFVGERYEKNLRNMSITAIIMMVMGFLMTLINVAQKQYIIALSPSSIFVASLFSYVSITRFRNRRNAVIASMLVIMIVLTYDVLFVDNGFAFLWALLVPLSVSYLFSVKTGILMTAYFQALFTVLFYSPLRQLVAARYTEITMSRFPLLFFFHGLLVLFAMYQYHKSVLFEIEYTDRLSEEVKKQTAVAEERSRRIEQMSFQTMQTLANAIDAKDPYTKGHSSRVSQYSVKIAEALGWEKERISDLRYAALLHDIGKIGVPDSILNNPKRLTEVEYSIIQSHTTMGADILKSKIMIEMAEDVARSHHERYDGKGYPQGLTGNEISEEARIVAIADAFDAMSSNRIYRKACGSSHIRKELMEGRGTQFDPHFVDIFIGLWDQGILDEIIKYDSPDDAESMEASSALLQEVMEKFAAQGMADDIDIITGIMGRTAGEAAIAQAMKDTSGCFAFIDLDNLKKINDTYGHKAGDRVLRMMGDTLKQCGENSFFCRLGGDEFLYYMKSVSREEAEEKIQQFICLFEEKKNAEAETSIASVSAGLAMCTPTDTYMKVYNRADKALYFVKQNGKNGYKFYTHDSESFRSETVDVNRLVSGIRNTGSYQGAMDVEYRQFATLYEYIENIKIRFSQPFKLIMITLEADAGEAMQTEDLERAMYYMEQAIRQTVRNVDVLTRYSRQQFLVILLGSDSEGVRIAVDRIFRGYYKMNGSSSFSPVYAVSDVDV